MSENSCVSHRAWVDCRWKYHVAITIAVMAFIFIQSALPGKVSSGESNFFVRILVYITGLPATPLKLYVRKAAHFTEYAVLGACLSCNARDWGQVLGGRLPEWKCWLFPWLAAAFYAVSDEIHQSFVPRRACTFTDMCIDAAGALMGIALFALSRFLFRKRAHRRCSGERKENIQ